jgi:DNA modification methylase
MIVALVPLSLKNYQENRHERGIYDKRNTLNDLTGKEWLFSTKTVISKIFPSTWLSSQKSRNYIPIPVDLSKELIETFSKPGDKILDPFAGIGSTILGNYFANESSTSPRRSCISIESNKTLINEYNDITKRLEIPDPELTIGDPLLILSEMKDNSVDFILSDIPVWDISNPEDSENIAIDLLYYRRSPSISLQKWYSSVCRILLESTKKLKELKYLVIAIPNSLTNSESTRREYPPVNFLLSSILAQNLQSIGLVLKSERIWFKANSAEIIPLYKTLFRRFLVFRKEEPPQRCFDHNCLFFGKSLPVGETYVIHKSFPPSFNHKLRSEHGGIKPPELAQILIEKYSNDSNDSILDPFAGVGGTLLGASISGRKAIGIDINERWKTIYSQVSQENGLSPQEFFIGDSSELIDKIITDNSIDLILTDVPYWAMDKLQKTRGRFSKAGEESRGKLHTPLHKFDQAAILTVEEWLRLLTTVFSKCYPKLIDGKYLVVFIGNMYRTISENRDKKARKVGKYLFLTSMLAKVLLEIGYSFINEIIWYAPDKSLHVFGYPFSYIPSVVHQSILIFKK